MYLFQFLSRKGAIVVFAFLLLSVVAFAGCGKKSEPTNAEIPPSRIRNVEENQTPPPPPPPIPGIGDETGVVPGMPPSLNPNDPRGMDSDTGIPPDDFNEDEDPLDPVDPDHSDSPSLLPPNMESLDGDLGERNEGNPNGEFDPMNPSPSFDPRDPLSDPERKGPPCPPHCCDAAFPQGAFPECSSGCSCPGA